ncbi:MAG: phosphoglycerate kinase [Candidatus Lambdaproteobacteria bacterium]|nr:phosphoglycerate kinase [Candidatus Lambdaproteobacteria bacterium]
MPKLSVDRIAVRDKTVLVRVDFNVPLAEGAVADDTRIRAALPTIRHLMAQGARQVLMSHLGRPKGKADPKLSLRPAADCLARLLGSPVAFSPAVIGEQAQAAVAALRPGGVLLLENLRFHPEEEKNDPAFAKALAALGDAYVSDAFGTVHRAHASTEGVAHYFQQAACGFLIARELEFLGKALEAPESPYVAILGGAKVGDKIAVIRSLLQRADTLLIGGGMAYTFLKAQGHGVGTSLLDEPHLELAGELLAEAKGLGKTLLLPQDHLVAAALDKAARAEPSGLEIPRERMGLDIGPATVAAYKVQIARARMVVWNGPMGVFEFPAFREGTFAVAHAMADCGGVTIVGGGDSVAAVNQAGVADRISHISTGGGASLEFLEGRTLPGIAALTEA